MALDPSTAARIDRGLEVLRARQRAGTAPPPGGISLEQLAAICGVGRETIRRVEATALAKCRRLLIQSGVTKEVLHTQP